MIPDLVGMARQLPPDAAPGDLLQLYIARHAEEVTQAVANATDAVLAQAVALTAPDEWHRLRWDPGPWKVRIDQRDHDAAHHLLVTEVELRCSVWCAL